MNITTLTNEIQTNQIDFNFRKNIYKNTINVNNQQYTGYLIEIF